MSTTQKGTKKVTAQGTGLLWLALRRREANSHATGVLRQVPLVAPDAAPSLHPNPLGEALIVVRSVIDTAKNRRLGEASVKKYADEGR